MITPFLASYDGWNYDGWNYDGWNYDGWNANLYSREILAQMSVPQPKTSGPSIRPERPPMFRMSPRE